MFLSFLIEIFTKPPRFKQYLYSLNKSLSPIGTSGAPSPPSLTSCSLKLFTVFIPVILLITFPLPICKVFPILG